MKKQGFTLIELLAVIVILAIIAIIAVPIILNIISDAKREADERSVELYAHAVKNAVAKKQLHEKVLPGEYTANSDGRILTNGDMTLNVEYDGEVVVCESVIIEENFKVNLKSCKVSGRKVDYTFEILHKIETPQDCFEINNEGMITSYLCTDTIKDVVIPKTINGIKVTSIGEMALAEKELTSVVMQDGITSIGMGAFGVNQLTNVVIPSSVTSIGDSAFAENQLTNIEIPNSVTSIGENAFINNQLTNVVIPSSVASIGKWAFSSNQLTNIVIPSSVTSIGEYTFAYNQLKSVIIKNDKDNVTLGSSSFYCPESGFDDSQVTYQP